MLNTARNAWIWFVEGLVEALLWVFDRLSRHAAYRLAVGADVVAVEDPQGKRIGRLVLGEGPGAFDPPDLARRLAGGGIDVVIPPSWLFRRDLDPVALASRPFLDAFVRHQIERITPWRVGDIHYRILQRPLVEDPNRLAVAVAVVPKRLVARVLAALDPLHPRALRLCSAKDGGGEACIALGGTRSQRATVLRRAVVGGLATVLLTSVGLVAVLQWQAASVRDDIDAQDRVLAERQAVLARARRGADPSGGAAAKLHQLREARPLATAVIEALSAAVPDSAHLTALSIEGDHVTIAGVSTEPSALVPALETSGAFAEVAFGGATTRAETGGDRFNLDMKALPQRSDHAPPPAGAAVAPPSPVAPALR